MKLFVVSYWKNNVLSIVRFVLFALFIFSLFIITWFNTQISTMTVFENELYHDFIYVSIFCGLIILLDIIFDYVDKHDQQNTKKVKV